VRGSRALPRAPAKPWRPSAPFAAPIGGLLDLRSRRHFSRRRLAATAEDRRIRGTDPLGCRVERTMCWVLTGCRLARAIIARPDAARADPIDCRQDRERPPLSRRARFAAQSRTRLPERSCVRTERRSRPRAGTSQRGRRIVARPRTAGPSRRLGQGAARLLPRAGGPRLTALDAHRSSMTENPQAVRNPTRQRRTESLRRSRRRSTPRAQAPRAAG